MESNAASRLIQVGLYRFGYTPCAAGPSATWCVEVVPDVVTELPSFDNGGLVENPDGTVTVRLEIRPEAVWEDGVPISGDDFAFTYRLHSDLAIDLYELVDPESLVVGPKSFQFTLTTPTVWWVYLFQPIVPKHDVEGTDIWTDWDGRWWVSGGPFRLESWEDDRVVVTRNPDYWRTDPDTGQQLPYLDRIEVGSFNEEIRAEVLMAAPAGLSEAVESYFDDGWQAVTDQEVEAIDPLVEQALLDALDSGYLDSVILFQMPVDEIADMVAPVLDGERIDGDLVATTHWEMLGFNMGPGRLGVNEDSWNEYLDFRRAVAHALDRDRVATAAFGVPWQRVDSYVSMASTTLSTGGWDRYAYDPERARELLAGLCDELGRDCEADPPRLVLHPFTLMVWRVDAAAEITAQLAQVGIEVETTTSGTDDFWCGDYDVVQVATGTLDPAPWNLIGVHDMWDPAGAPPSGWNSFRWGTEAVEGVEDDPATDGFDESCFNSGPSAVIDEYTARMAEILEQMRVTLDVEQLRPLIQEAEEIAADQVVFIPMYASTWWWLWSTDLTGWREGDPFANAEHLYRTDP